MSSDTVLAEDAFVLFSSLTPIDPDPNSRLLSLTREEPVVHIGRSSRRNASLEPHEHNAYFDCPVMSRAHAELRLNLEKRVITIQDTNSLHGTLVNKLPLRPTERRTIKTGDTISFGLAIERGSDQFTPQEVEARITWKSKMPPPKVISYRVPDDTDIEEISDKEDEMPTQMPYAREVLREGGFCGNNVEGQTIDLTNTRLPPIKSFDSHWKNTSAVVDLTSDESSLRGRVNSSGTSNLPSSSAESLWRPDEKTCPPVACNPDSSSSPEKGNTSRWIEATECLSDCGDSLCAAADDYDVAEVEDERSDYSSDISGLSDNDDSILGLNREASEEGEDGDSDGLELSVGEAVDDWGVDDDDLASLDILLHGQDHDMELEYMSTQPMPVDALPTIEPYRPVGKSSLGPPPVFGYTATSPGDVLDSTFHMSAPHVPLEASNQFERASKAEKTGVSEAEKETHPSAPLFRFDAESGSQPGRTSVAEKTRLSEMRTGAPSFSPTDFTLKSNIPHPAYPGSMNLNGFKAAAKTSSGLSWASQTGKTEFSKAREENKKTVGLSAKASESKKSDELVLSDGSELRGGIVSDLMRAGDDFLNEPSQSFVPDSGKQPELNETSAYQFEMSKRASQDEFQKAIEESTQKAINKGISDRRATPQLVSKNEGTVKPALKRKADKISESTRVEDDAAEAIHPTKRFRRAAEVVGYVAMGGIAVMSALIATAPQL